MAIKQTITNVSYLRNHDYSKSIEWSDQMNEDLYKMFLEAKQELELGYMKRMTHMWDVKYPEYSYLTPKQLRQHATFVEHKKQRPEISKQSTASMLNLPLTGELEEQTHLNEDHLPESDDAEILDSQLVSTLETAFARNYNIFAVTTLNKRPYSTRNVRIIKQEQMKAINHVITKFIKSKVDLSFWEINTIHYTAAVTFIELNNKLQMRIKPKSNDKRDA